MTKRKGWQLNKFTMPASISPWNYLLQHVYIFYDEF